MPTCGDRNAPSFNQKARELPRYFDKLNHLFARAQLMDDTAKKRHVVRYLDVATAEEWEARPEYKDPTKTYRKFQDAIVKLYPGANEDRKYTIADMDTLVGSRYRLGIASSGELSEFYRQFFAITDFLVKKSRISTRERDIAFLRAFQDSLMNWVATRVQIKLPDHDKETPYPMAGPTQQGAQIASLIQIYCFFLCSANFATVVM
ncbi:hypothetical protein FA95DRAFT_1485210 [Auriscalpium vulgare]|uniref:Uncharacterized protein n=1 Tax=Auriscalpium vulgare TaxID=40419 RepID=A0ACB8S5J8_9AGAM|nr:hypothetical protein FA95DRAFT_1485210 [Auriscalpium vulgare]